MIVKKYDDEFQQIFHNSLSLLSFPVNRFGSVSKRGKVAKELLDVVEQLPLAIEKEITKNH